MNYNSVTMSFRVANDHTTVSHQDDCGDVAIISMSAISGDVVADLSIYVEPSQKARMADEFAIIADKLRRTAEAALKTAPK